MDVSLMEEAYTLEINAGLYNLLPADKRESALKADIVKEKARKEKVYGQT